MRCLGKVRHTVGIASRRVSTREELPAWVGPRRGGRLTIDGEAPAAARLTIRLSAEQVACLEEWAARHRLTVSEYARRVLMGEIPN
jgi:hypothetical protein